VSQYVRNQKRKTTTKTKAPTQTGDIRYQRTTTYTQWLSCWVEDQENLLHLKRDTMTSMPSSSVIERHGASQCSQKEKKKSSEDDDDTPFTPSEVVALTPPRPHSLPSASEGLSPCFARRRSNISPHTSRLLHECSSPSCQLFVAEQDLWLPDLDAESNNNTSPSRRITLRPRFSPMRSEEDPPAGILDERDRGMIFRHVLIDGVSSSSSSLRFPSLCLDD
jgi:hypothetical protein